MRRIISGEKSFSFKLSETVEGSFDKPTIKFSAKFLKKVFAYSPKVKEEMKISKSVFLS